MKAHTTLGHSIITNSIPNANDVSMVALHHHERLDGSGYPNGISGSEIHPMAKIVAVADVYSAMISSRVYQKKKDLLFVLREIHKLSFTQLDPTIVLTFIQRMSPNFIGKKLILRTGEIGTIIMNNPSDPFRPLIQVDDKFIDLSKDHSLEIETIFQN
jgi:HD-GYP domain-containing protein (c-di-GMP phosphodiesterase class II)